MAVLAGLAALPVRAEFTDAYVQVSVFLHEGSQSGSSTTSGFGRFGTGFTDVPLEFSWGNTVTRGPTVTHGWAGLGLLFGPTLAGYRFENGTGIYQWGATQTSQASTVISTNGNYTWQGPDIFNGIAWSHYILQGRVGPNPGDKVEFTSDVTFYLGDGRNIPMHLHYLNDQPGATFSGVDLYMEAPCSFQPINGNSSVQISIIGNVTFFVTDPNQGSISGVGNIGPTGGASPTPPPVTTRPSRALNISTRMRVLNGDSVLIGGFIINGISPKRVLLRGLGPSLTGFGVPNALQDPTLELHDNTGTVIAFNNDWMESQATEIQNTGLAPGDTHEAAIIQTLAPGAYTATLKGNQNGVGVGIVELYDVDPASSSNLANISTRGFASTGDDVMIGGFIIGDSGSDPARVVVRAIGPSLAQFGIPNPLANPTLELHNGDGALLQSNDNWRESQQSEIEATNLAPQNDLESAIAAFLPVGNYTAIVRGAGETSGVALVEAYKLP